MKNYTQLLLILPFIIFISCGNNLGTEKHQGKRDNIVNVREQVKEIKVSEDDVLIGSVVRLHLLDNYLLIRDSKSFDKLIRIFDKNDFKYITSICQRGQGPNEIANMGHIGINEKERIFYVNDHGKQKIFAYNIDSVLADQGYSPTVKMEMNEKLFPDKYQYFSDTLSMGLIITPIGNNDFDQTVGKWNMSTGEIKLFPYKHPDIKKKRIHFAVSIENNIYIECYTIRDLITICNLDGDIMYVIYGPEWSEEPSSIEYFGKAVFCGNSILVAYSGGNRLTDYEPTKFMVFDLTGNYIKTLDIGYKIPNYCYDKANNRIIMNINDLNMQFAYLDLDGLID